MPLAPKHRFLGGGGGGGGAVGLTEGHTTAGFGGGGGGGGEAGVSLLRGGPGKSELVLELARMACTLSISQSPDDKIVFRVFWLIKRARFKKAEIVNTIANPKTNSSSLPLASRFPAHYKIKETIMFLILKTTLFFVRTFQVILHSDKSFCYFAIL